MPIMKGFVLSTALEHSGMRSRIIRTPARIAVSSRSHVMLTFRMIICVKCPRRFCVVTHNLIIIVLVRIDKRWSLWRMDTMPLVKLIKRKSVVVRGQSKQS